MASFARPALVATALFLVLAAPAAPQDIAIRAGLVHTMAGPPIQDGLVLVRDGKIAEVGPAKLVQVPMACRVVELKDGVILPALVQAHNSEALDRPNENLPVAPFDMVADELNPGGDDVEQLQRAGFGTVHVIPGHDCLLGGVGLVVRPWGVSIQAMTVADPRIQKMSLAKRGLGRTRAVETLEKALADMAAELAERDRDAAEAAAEARAQGKEPDKAAKPKELPPEKRDLAALVTGKAKAFFYCQSPTDVDYALRLVGRYKFGLVPVLGGTSWKAADRIKTAGLGAVLEPDLEIVETDPETGKESEICPAAELHRAGVPFALSSGGQSLPERYPLWQAAIAVRWGVPAETALAALTTVPARLLGLEKRLGSLEKGKDGNVVLLTGDPFAAGTWVDRLIVEGREIYARDKDPLYRKLFPPKEEEK